MVSAFEMCSQNGSNEINEHLLFFLVGKLMSTRYDVNFTRKWKSSRSLRLKEVMGLDKAMQTRHCLIKPLMQTKPERLTGRSKTPIRSSFPSLVFGTGKRPIINRTSTMKWCCSSYEFLQDTTFVHGAGDPVIATKPDSSSLLVRISAKVHST